MILARFRVEVAIAIRHSLMGLGQHQAQAVEGVAVRAVPIHLPEQGKLNGWYASTPNGQIGFSVFGPEAMRFKPGYEFEMTIHP